MVPRKVISLYYCHKINMLIITIIVMNTFVAVITITMTIFIMITIRMMTVFTGPGRTARWKASAPGCRLSSLHTTCYHHYYHFYIMIIIISIFIADIIKTKNYYCSHPQS